MGEANSMKLRSSTAIGLFSLLSSAGIVLAVQARPLNKVAPDKPWHVAMQQQAAKRKVAQPRKPQTPIVGSAHPAAASPVGARGNPTISPRRKSPKWMSYGGRFGTPSS